MSRHLCTELRPWEQYSFFAEWCFVICCWYYRSNTGFALTCEVLQPSILHVNLKSSIHKKGWRKLFCMNFYGALCNFSDRCRELWHRAGWGIPPGHRQPSAALPGKCWHNSLHGGCSELPRRYAVLPRAGWYCAQIKLLKVLFWPQKNCVCCWHPRYVILLCFRERSPFVSSSRGATCLPIIS